MLVFRVTVFNCNNQASYYGYTGGGAVLLADSVVCADCASGAVADEISTDNLHLPLPCCCRILARYCHALSMTIALLPDHSKGDMISRGLFRTVIKTKNTIN